MVKCEHKRIKSENCVLSCIDCGEILPNDFLTPKNGAKTTHTPSADEGVGKTTTRKRAAKKGD